MLDWALLAPPAGSERRLSPSETPPHGARRLPSRPSLMITGRWGKPSEVLLDLVVEEDGTVRGIANPGRQNAPIRRGHFDAISGVVNLEGEHVRPDGTTLPFRIARRLDGRTLRLAYQYGDMRGETDVVRVEEYTPPPLTLWDRLRPRIAGLKR